MMNGIDQKMSAQAKVYITIDPRAVQRVQSGYPWIFRSEMAGNPPDSVAVPAHFIGDKGQFIARGYYNPLSQLAGRVLTLDLAEGINADFIKRRLQTALNYREHLYPGAPFYRLVHAESDGLPGLIIDRFSDVLVVQVNTAGMDGLYPLIKDALINLVNPRAIVLRNDTSSRLQEGLEQYVRVDYGVLDQPEIEMTENNVRYLVNVIDGQKTGWFFDQRHNRQHVAVLSRGKSMVDVFSHTGGFGVAAAVVGAKSVSFIDSSHAAIEGAMKNAQLNKVYDLCNGIEGKSFDVLETMARGQQVFDVVCVDPPAFIKTRKDMGSGLKGYEKLAKLAVSIVAKGGYLFFASCSHHAATEELFDAVTTGLGKSKRPFQLIRTGFAGPDHPVHPHLPETGYLKAFTFRFLD